VWASTRQARAQIASALALYQEAAQELAVDLARAYGDVRFAREALIAQEESLANLEEQARFARANLREGFLTRTDVAQAEARVAQARADLARAHSRVVQASEFYMRVTGHPPGSLVDPEKVGGLPEALDAALEMAEEHPGLVAAAANIRAADAGVGLAASSGRMRVFLESNDSRFDVIGPSDEFNEESEGTVNVRVAIPLFTGGAVRARTRQQRYLRDAARYDLANAQRVVRERVTVAWAELDATRARMEASQARLEAAELASRGVRREQQFGQRSMIDVLNQEQERLAARVALAEAERDAMVAERVYAAAIGQITQLLGIEVNDGSHGR
jgi:TolC family type I secretion outer membrane protein